MRAGFQARYRLGGLDYDESHNTVFALCDLADRGKKLVLTGPEWRSATMEQLFHALRHNPAIPSLAEFRKTLKKRMEDQSKVRFRLAGNGHGPPRRA